MWTNVWNWWERFLSLYYLTRRSRMHAWWQGLPELDLLLGNSRRSLRRGLLRPGTTIQPWQQKTKINHMISEALFTFPISKVYETEVRKTERMQSETILALDRGPRPELLWSASVQLGCNASFFPILQFWLSITHANRSSSNFVSGADVFCERHIQTFVWCFILVSSIFQSAHLICEWQNAEVLWSCRKSISWYLCPIIRSGFGYLRLIFVQLGPLLLSKCDNPS